MELMKSIMSRTISKAVHGYTEFVYKTSRIKMTGFDNICRSDGENVLFLFWHGDSCCLYPAFTGRNLFVLTTKNRRGDYIADICRRFGYRTLRVPDDSDGGSYIREIVRTVSENSGDMAVALDGPLGPYHMPKYFPVAMAYMLKRRIIRVTVSVDRKIILSRRWDRFKVPLPFNYIELKFHEPVSLTKKDKAERFETIIQAIRDEDSQEDKMQSK